LQEIIELLTNKLKKIPLKIERTALKDFAQNEDRTRMAKLTHQISVFTESILNMETYLIVKKLKKIPKTKQK
jgi:WASH complex subunit strumpellin